ncbi:hypothetical protein HDU96_004302, partial [Phlyctochytrium bullatum]
MSANADHLATAIVLILSLPLGLHNLIICLKESIRRPRTYIQHFQSAASLFQLLNQASFTVLFWVPASSPFFNIFRKRSPDDIPDDAASCTWFLTLADTFYYLFSVLCHSVLIVRTTGLLQRRQVPLRLLFGTMLLSATGCILASTIKRRDIVDPDGKCVGQYIRELNTIGKCIVFAMYVGLLGVFVVPAYHHLKLAGKEGLAPPVSATGSKRRGACPRSTTTQEPTAATYLFRIVMNVSTRILLAMLGYLVTV